MQHPNPRGPSECRCFSHTSEDTRGGFDRASKFAAGVDSTVGGGAAVKTKKQKTEHASAQMALNFQKWLGWSQLLIKWQTRLRFAQAVSHG